MKKLAKAMKSILKVLIPIWWLIYIWPKKKVVTPFSSDEQTRPLNIAHRGGAALAPEETIEAFSIAKQVGADMFEYDVHISKDGHLIASHDPTVNRITTGKGFINDLTLAEIKSFDAGFKFVDANGQRPFESQGVRLAMVEEIFLAFPDTPAVIELKHTNDSIYYEAMIQEMWRLIQKYHMEDKVIVASFDHSINQRFQEISQGRVAIGGGESEAESYITKMVLRLNGLANTDAQAFQLPLIQQGIDLTQKNIIEGSRRRGIAVYYWTVNDEETMRQLIAKGVDGIMTDNPALLQIALNESGV